MLEKKNQLMALLPSENILILKDATSKTDVISQLTQLVCQGENSLDYTDVFTQILKREESLSTTLDTGLSIPHARLEELTKIKAALAILPHGLKDPAKSVSIKAMFLFLSPAQPIFFQQHLQLLASLAETFKIDFITDLAHCQTSQEAANKFIEK
ncbi:MAG: PTS sugar transporter subunit IIA [Elusimicrobiaceae bacterium]|nr:PTS sugar transporter subunit IIA [Elusimicrobiaceae bacterium]